MVRWLDREEVLRETVTQLRKDLSMSAEGLPVPPVGDSAFGVLQASVLPHLEALQESGAHALKVVLYRVDIPEAHMHRTLEMGGLNGLAGECVLRALQKVLTRMRFAGRF